MQTPLHLLLAKNYRSRPCFLALRLDNGLECMCCICGAPCLLHFICRVEGVAYPPCHSGLPEAAREVLAKEACHAAGDNREPVDPDGDADERGGEGPGEGGGSDERDAFEASDRDRDGVPPCLTLLTRHYLHLSVNPLSFVKNAPFLFLVKKESRQHSLIRPPPSVCHIPLEVATADQVEYMPPCLHFASQVGLSEKFAWC